MFIFSSLIHFWILHPALFYGLAALLGCYTSFYFSFLLFIPTIFLWIPFCFSFSSVKPLLLNLSLFFSMWFYTSSFYQLPSLPQDGLVGTAYFQIQQVSQQQTIFGKQLLYRGQIHYFSSFSTLFSFPCSISLKAAPNHPCANQDYWITGTLLKTLQGYKLKPSKKLAWQPVPCTFSRAEERLKWKQQVVEWIHRQFTYETSAKFIAGLATGEFEDLLMKEQFAYFGLQHLLAISGFHFTLIASLLNFFFRFIVSFKVRLWLLLIVLSSYCFFLGPQPSILRAWILCLVTFGGELFYKQSSSLNGLGVALIFLTLINPLFCLEVGFQLSFAVTFALLIFSKPTQALFCLILTKRSLGQLLEMNVINQVAYCVLTFFREGVALTLAVNLFAFPLTLYYFHQFPLMGLLYNLFFPLFASLSLALLLIGIFLQPIPGVKFCIDFFNDSYTFYLLKLTHSFSTKSQAYLTVESFSLPFLIFYLCFLALWGIIWRQKKFEKTNLEVEF